MNRENVCFPGCVSSTTFTRPPLAPTKGIKCHTSRTPVSVDSSRVPGHYRHAICGVPYLLGHYAPSQDVRPRPPRLFVRFVLNCISQVHYDYCWICPRQDGYVPAGSVSWSLPGLYERRAPCPPLRERCPRLHTVEHIGIGPLVLDRVHVSRYWFPLWLVGP